MCSFIQKYLISHIMQVPSLDDETISRSNLLMCSDAIGAVCSFKTLISFCSTESIFQIRICPSHPPDINKVSQLVMANAEQPENSFNSNQTTSCQQKIFLKLPFLWALGMAEINLPVSGVNDRITPSFQPVMIDCPSYVNTTAAAVKFGTTMRNNSFFFINDHTRTDS